MQNGKGNSYMKKGSFYDLVMTRRDLSLRGHKSLLSK